MHDYRIKGSNRSDLFELSSFARRVSTDTRQNFFLTRNLECILPVTKRVVEKWERTFFLLPDLTQTGIAKSRFLCRLRSIAAHRDHFVRCLSVRVSVCPVTLSWQSRKAMIRRRHMHSSECCYCVLSL